MRADNHFSIKELSNKIGGVFEGDGEYIINGLSSLPSSTPTDLTFYVSNRYREQLHSCKAGCVLLRPHDKHHFSGNKILVDDPYLGFAKLTALFINSKVESYIHPSAVIAASAKVGDNVTIGANVVIEEGCAIDEGCFIGANSYVGKNSCVGLDTILHPNVTLYNGVSLGNNCIIHSGSVVGADGFGFAPSAEGWQKIHQLGGVRIGNNVEVGANTTIDRGALDDTVVEDGVKIDNLVQIAHNVYIGENTAIASSVAIAGSAVIGKRCTISGCAGIVGHISICDDVHITGMTMVSKSILKAGSYSSGVPMNETKKWRKNAARFNHLDEIARQIKLLSK